jgi:cyclic beta-1,2-glucan synthetase
LLQDLFRAFAQIGLTITFAAHQATAMADATTRTLYRLAVSRRHLLEWVSAAQMQRAPQLSLAGYYAKMWGSTAVAVAAVAAGLLSQRANLTIAVPFAALWALAPLVALWVSRWPALTEETELSAQDARALKLIARRTWRFFEVFVTADNNMLPPDNYQEDPKPVVARRTSPTNIGLYLLCAVSARDFGWVGLHDTVDRLDATFATLKKMEKLHGHLFNWYATADLRPLEPRYVSTVDSGNMAGHLIVLANACRDWITNPYSTVEALDGIEDCLDLAVETLNALPTDSRATAKAKDHVTGLLETLSRSVANSRLSADILFVRLLELSIQAAQLVEVVELHTKENPGIWGSELLVWLKAARWSESKAMPEAWRLEWTSTSCSTGNATCCLLDFACRTARSTTQVTTCLLPRRAWQAFSPLPRAMSAPSTGSGWIVRSPLSNMVRHSSRGRGRCSNI